MISLLPSTSPSDTYAAFAVIALITDVDASKKRLDELVAAANEAKSAREDAQKLSAEAEESRRAAEAAQDDAKKLSAASESKKDELAASENSLREKQADIESRASKLDTIQRSLDNRERDLNNRDEALNKRDQAIAKQEATTKQALDAAAALKVDLQKRLAKLQVVAAGNE